MSQSNSLSQGINNLEQENSPLTTQPPGHRSNSDHVAKGPPGIDVTINQVMAGQGDIGEPEPTSSLHAASVDVVKVRSHNQVDIEIMDLEKGISQKNVSIQKEAESYAQKMRNY